MRTPLPRFFVMISSVWLTTYPAAAQVTSVTASASGGSGPCPALVRFDAPVTTASAVDITYRWARSDGAIAPVQKASFRSAGTYTLSSSWMLGVPYKGWMKLVIESPAALTSAPADFEVTCGSAPSPVPSPKPTPAEPQLQRPKVVLPAPPAMVLPAPPPGQPRAQPPAPPPPPAQPPIAQPPLPALPPAALTEDLGFEAGTLTDWEASGSAFAEQPVDGDTVTTDRARPGMAYNRGGIGGDYWKGMSYPIGIKGSYWVGTSENGAGEGATGTLMSEPLPVQGRYLTFLLGGGKDINRLHVELQVRKTDYEQAWGAGRRAFFGDTDDGFARVNRISPLLNSEDLFRYSFDLAQELNGKPEGVVRVVVVDQSTTGHINVDDFQFVDSLKQYLAVQRDGFGLLADPDKPVWGFADLHAHWMNHIGTRGFFHGTPGMAWRTSDPRADIPPCDGYRHGGETPIANIFLAAVEPAALVRAPERVFGDLGHATCAAAMGASALGQVPQLVVPDPLAVVGALAPLMLNPVVQACAAVTVDVTFRHYNNTLPASDSALASFIDYPRWNTFNHQTMHITWVRRSYEGGQRLIVVPVGAAKSWEFFMTRDGQTGDAKVAIEEQVNYLKQMVQANADWLQVAYSAADARRIVLGNRMAVVIALEHAEIGNYGFPSAAQEVEWLYGLGIRHVFPIHNTDNRIGGTALFKNAVGAYNDLVNRRSPSDPMVLFAPADGQATRPGDEVDFALETVQTRQLVQTVPIAGFGDVPFVQFVVHDFPFATHRNARGLEGYGEAYTRELMGRGMVIDVDHQSDASLERTLELLESVEYPVVSGHSNFRTLRRSRGETSFKDDKIRTEFTLTDRVATEVNRQGGMFGLMTQQNDIRAFGSQVVSNSAGSSRSFAQAYLYALDKTGGRAGIAFGTDFNGFAPQVAPRFGTGAAPFLEGDAVRNRSYGGFDQNTERRRQVFAQERGVRYDSPVGNWHYHRFPSASYLTSEEREIWEALALAKSGHEIEHAWQPGGGGLGGLTDPARTALQINKVRNLAHGFTTADVGWLACPEYGLLRGQCPTERRAAYMAVHGERSLPDDVKDDELRRLYPVVKTIYDQWSSFESGPNEPLRRSHAFPGGRDFDFNIDGLAHYGMLPDLIQDLKNVGLRSAQLQPLFMAAEQYVETMERAEAAGARVR